MSTTDPELIIGLVAPLGTNTGELAETVRALLSDCNYRTVVIKLSSLLPTAGPVPPGESEDERIRRLISAGNAFCEANHDAAAMAHLAVASIRAQRVALQREDGDDRPVDELPRRRPRTAYILQSLKRSEEVKVLRLIYGAQFILIGSQGSLSERTQTLMRKSLSAADEQDKLAIVEDLIRLDADDQIALGQNVNNTYPQADFFVRNNSRADIDRVIGLLFGEPKAPTIGEFAMYVAVASRARSLAASRKVGAAIVIDDAVVATGYNDVPHGQTPDVIQGIDTSENFKQDNLRDTLQRLQSAGLLVDGLAADDEGISKAAAALDGGELMSVIEYQRAVHAEARAIDDATVRGVSTRDGVLYVTTYPCHLCYKHALSARLKSVEYIEPYPKSRAVAMFSDGAQDRLVPFAGVAPRRYMETFDDRKAFKADSAGKFVLNERKVAQPLVGTVGEDKYRDQKERQAVNNLKEEYR